MRILFSERDGTFGGSIYSLYWLATELSRSHLVGICVRGEPPYARLYREAGIPVLRVAGRLIELKGELKRDTPLRKNPVVWTLLDQLRFVLESVPLGLRLAALFRQLRPDLVHLNGSVSLYQAEILGARLAGIPVVCHLRGRSGTTPGPQGRLLISFVAQFIAVSRATAENAIGIGHPADRMRVIHNCVPARAALSEEERLEGRRREGLAAGCWAVTAGQLTETKGVLQALRAVAAVRARGTDLRLLVLGDGPRASSLRAEARALGIEHVVQFKGWVSSASDYFALADVLVHPNQYYDAFPRAIIEAMACGLPIVGTDVGGIPETFTDGVSGLLVHGAGHQPLVEPLETLARNAEQRRKMGRAAREEATRRYGVEPHTAAVENVYAQVLAEAAARGR